MAKDSAIVSADIGRDVELHAPDTSKVYVGEVNQLRVRFNGMLQDFQTTRDESERSLRPNPFFDSIALPNISLQDPLQQIAKELIVPAPAGKRTIVPCPVQYVEPPPITTCNRLRTVLRVCVMGPTCAGLILVVVIVAVILSVFLFYLHPNV